MADTDIDAIRKKKAEYAKQYRLNCYCNSKLPKTYT
jgi:hypothetical protein